MKSYKDSGTRTIEKIRRKVKVLQEKSKLVVNALERGRNDMEKQNKQAVKRQYELEMQSTATEGSEAPKNKA